jgi:hypothetical protein
LARQALYWVGGKGKIEDGNACDPEGAAIDGGVSVDLHHHSVGVELPLGAGKFAGSDGPVIHHVVIRPALLYQFPGEGKRVRRSQDEPLAPQPQSAGAIHMFEAACFGPDVVTRVRRFHVLVIGPSVEHDVAIGDCISGVRVVIHRIGAQAVGAVVNLRLTAQFEHGSVFFLLHSPDGDLLFSDRRRRGRRWRWRCGLSFG